MISITIWKPRLLVAMLTVTALATTGALVSFADPSDDVVELALGGKEDWITLDASPNGLVHVRNTSDR